MTMRARWYRRAAQSIGFSSLLNLQYQKRFGGELMRLTSGNLRHPVLARRASSDIHVFHQVFVDRDYACVEHLREPRFIVDLGANVGYTSAYFLSRFPNCRVLALEPDPDNFALLQRNLQPYGNRARALQRAVWWRAQTLQFKQRAIKGEEWGRSLGEETGSGDDDLVPSITMDMIFEDSKEPRISILKVDIEGAEKELFSHDASWLDLVDNVVIELHGEECRRAFFAAAESRIAHKTTSGELTYCAMRGASPKSSAA